MDQNINPVVYDLSEDFFASNKFIRGPVLGGGMTGEVVLAIRKKNRSDQRAVKLFSLLAPDGGIRNIRLFNNESTNMQRLLHQNIVKHIISFRCPDYFLICTEYCPNGTLTSRLQDLTPELCTKYFLQMVSAVHYLNNEQGVIHNDIKPCNIFINASDDAVLGDFGLSFPILPNTRSVSASGMGGTLHYSAPEKFFCSNVDPLKLDAFSLGVVLLSMLLKRRQTFDSRTQLLADIPLMMSLDAGHRLALDGLTETDPSRRFSVTKLINSFVSHGFYPHYFSTNVPDRDTPETGLPQTADVDSSDAEDSSKDISGKLPDLSQLPCHRSQTEYTTPESYGFEPRHSVLISELQPTDRQTQPNGPRISWTADTADSWMD